MKQFGFAANQAFECSLGLSAWYQPFARTYMEFTQNER
jgi:hypothetical protein